MNGIPANLYSELKKTLFETDRFYDYQTLRAIFVDSRINLWQNKIPKADNPDQQVAKVIDWLIGQTRHDTGDNGLVLLLRVLQNNIPEADQRFHDLATLATKLDERLINQVEGTSVETNEPQNEANQSSLKPSRYIAIYAFHGSATPDSIDWTAYFNSNPPRKIPPPAVWDSELLPILQSYQTTITQGPIHLLTQVPPSVGLAFGNIFYRTAGYHLNIYDNFSHTMWSSTAEPPDNVECPYWQASRIEGSAQSTEAVVMVSALGSRKGNLIMDVGRHLNESVVVEQLLKQQYNHDEIERWLTQSFDIQELQAFGKTLGFQINQDAYHSCEQVAAELTNFAKSYHLETEIVDWFARRIPRLYKSAGDKLYHPYQSSQQVKGILYLQAEPAVSQKKFLGEWDSVLLAERSRELINTFIADLRPNQVRVYLATPATLAILLGHHWNALGAPLQCYEIDGQGGYLPACRLLP